MTPCQVRDRAAVDRACARLRQGCAHVLAAGRVRTARSQTDRWAVEILADSAAGGIPPEVCRVCADHELTIRRVHRGRACWRATATA